MGRLRTVADASNNYMTITAATDYNAAGQLKHFTYGNGVTADFGYNDHLQVASIRYWKTGSLDLLNLSYNYGSQNNGEIATITDNQDASHTMSYKYDPWSRLDTAQAGPDATPTWKYSYVYDRFGNRKQQNPIAGGSAYLSVLTIDPNTNRITDAGNTYDAAGNMTNDHVHAYAFDAENRVKTVDSTGASYTYDAANQRVLKTVGATTTVYIFSGASVIAEYAAGAAAGSPSKEYVASGRRTLASVSAGAVTYYHPDQLSARAETNGNGTTSRTFGHFPYGEDWYETGAPNKWKYTTYERDAESNLNYAMNRYHSGQKGRFLTPDLLAGSIAAPQSLNRYAYAGDDPVNYMDPTGLLLCINSDCVNNPSGDAWASWGFSTIDGVPVENWQAQAAVNSGFGQVLLGFEVNHGIVIDPNGNGDPALGTFDELVLYVAEGGRGSGIPGFDARVKEWTKGARMLLKNPKCSKFFGGKGLATLNATTYIASPERVSVIAVTFGGTNTVGINPLSYVFQMLPDTVFMRQLRPGGLSAFEAGTYAILHELAHELSQYTGAADDRFSQGLNYWNSLRVMNACSF
jgi:RHS repeat-associated protein